MRLLATLVLFLSSTVFAATHSFRIESEIEMDGEIVAKPNFIMAPGKRASLTETADKRLTYVEVIAHDDHGPAKSDAIMMKFKVALLRNGQHKIHEPTLIVRPGQPAELAVGDSQGTERFRMKVVAHRQSQ